MWLIRIVMTAALLAPAIPALAVDPPEKPKADRPVASTAPADPAKPAPADPAKPETVAVPAVDPAAPAAHALEIRIEELERQLAAMQAEADAQKPDQEKSDEGDRLDKLEKKASLDRLNITGEIRVGNDSLFGTQAAHYDGLKLQKGIVDTLFYAQTNRGAFPLPSNPKDPNSIYQTLANNVGAHYAEYQAFTGGLKFNDLKAAVGSFPAAAQQALFQLLTPATFVPQQDYDNNILYTTRLRLNLRSEINEHMSFSGRLAMYKVWGDSSGVQVFNGQPNSINIDGTTVGVPNSDIVRVDRAYFDWNSIGDTGLYFSIGRRPSTGGPPLDVREGRLRGGTPLGHVVDYQFDGITVGYAFKSVPGMIFRYCYGLGYESGFGNGDQLVSPANRLKDVHFGGFNLDLYQTDSMMLQTTVLRAYRVTDGFNALVVLPVDPVTGNSVPAPVVMRFTPSANLGDIDLQAFLARRTDGPLTYFASIAADQTHPDNVTTPFGGLMSDPFSTPEARHGWSVYTGARFDLANGSTKIGAEYNHGSRYWFNFTQAADDILLSKLAVRGNVFEAYFIQDLGKNASVRLSGINYQFDYSGSGWHVGEPKKLSDTPMLGFPTYKDMFNLRLSMTVRF